MNRKWISITVAVIGAVGVIIAAMVTKSDVGTLSRAQPATQVASTKQTTTNQRQGTGTVLYQAEWSNGLNGWAGTPDWQVLDGELINDGTNSGNQKTPTILAPCNLGTVSDYAIEVKVHMIRQGYDPGFGFFVRYIPNAHGYMAGVTDLNSDKSGYSDRTVSFQVGDGDPVNWKSPLQITQFDPGTVEHTYRIELKSNRINIFVDGRLLLEVADNRYLSGGCVGLWDKNIQLRIASYKVIAL